jgi:putative transcriptional regulator
MIRKRKRGKRRRRKTTETPVTPLAAFIKRARKEAGLTQQDLSNLSGVGHRTLAAIESGSDPKVSSLQKLADALGESTDAMLGRTS